MNIFDKIFKFPIVVNCCYTPWFGHIQKLVADTDSEVHCKTLKYSTV